MSVNTRTTLHKILESQSQSKHRKPISARLRFYCLTVFFISGLLMTGILLFQLPTGMEGPGALIGEPSPRTFFSPFEVKYVNEKMTESLRDQKSSEVLRVFEIDPLPQKEAQRKLEQLSKFFEKFRAETPEEKSQDLGKAPLKISDATAKYLAQTVSMDDFQKNLQIFFDRVFSAGILDAAKKQELLQTGIREVTQADSLIKEEKKVAVPVYLTVENLKNDGAGDVFKKDHESRAAAQEIIAILIQPNLKFNEAETQFRKIKAAASIPAVEELIKKDELVVQRGMLVTPEVKERLVQIQKKLAAHKVLNQLFVLAYLIILIYVLGFSYLLFFERRFLGSIRQIIFLHTCLLLNVLLCKAALLVPNSSAYFMPGALAALLVSILANPRIGFLCALMSAVLTAPLVDFAPEIILSILLSSIAGIFGTVRLRKRAEFLKVGLFMGITSFVLILIYRIYHEYPIDESVQVAMLGLTNGLLITTPLCFLLVPFFEYFFNLTSEISLLELSDLNHPLLKRMIVEAPGTYHHSLVVSTLAESACEAIGANALLARVGCYFHDIGKIPRAEFFTENQSGKGISNKHEKLTPSMSSLVILNHVKDGIELGRQYKLKDPILRFIPEHQGTGVIYYFYRKALDRAKPGEKINPDDFRYPGPKPQSKETAVALLSDSTEAASRSLKEPSPESIRNLVRKVINDKFIDGQLDECDLTLKDLHKIQESFVHNLMAIFHTRVTYPAPTMDECNNPDLFADAPDKQFPKFRAESKKEEML